MNRVLAALAAVGLLWAAQAAAQGAAQPDVAKGGQVAKQICAACHAADGNSVAAANPKLASQFPRLSGQFADYVETQLKLFRAGGRANDPSGMMRGVAGRMNDQEIKAVAEYAAGLR